MRIALLADVHANREALEACLAHARREGADRFVFLGDLVGYGADPELVLEAAAGLCAQGGQALLGNHDAAMLNGPERAMREDAREAVVWTRPLLTVAHRRFLAALPLLAEGPDSLYVHANAWQPSEWEYVATSTEAGRSLAATHSRLTFCGHIHVPALYHQGPLGRVAEFAPVPGVAVPLGSRHRWLAVLGSVGQPRDGNPAACYAVHDVKRRQLTFHRVPYDVEGAARRIVERGLPAWLGARLEAGG